MIVVATMTLLGGACTNADRTASVDSTAPTTTPAPAASSTTTAVPPDVTAAEGLGDSFYPYLGNGGYDVLRYDIDINVDPAANTIQALTTITARAAEELSAFNLDLSVSPLRGLKSMVSKLSSPAAGRNSSSCPPARLPTEQSFLRR